jgi:hypothetical protein
MPKTKPPDYLRKESISLSIPSHLNKALTNIHGQKSSKSELITEILLENLDRLTDGSIDTAIKHRQIEINQQILQTLQKEHKLFERKLHELGSIEMMIMTVQTNIIALRDASKQLNEAVSTLTKLKKRYKLKELTQTISKQLKEEGNKLAKELHDW